MAANKINSYQGIILGYYPLRGKIQVCRLLCEYLHLTYKQYLFTPQTWQEFKSTQNLKWNYQQLPFLKDQQFVVTQTFPICYYLIKKANKIELMGKTPEDQAKVDMFVWEFDIMSQILSLLASFKNMTLQKKYQIFDRYWHDHLRTKFMKIQNEAENQYYISYMTIVDFYIYDLWYFFRLTNIEGYMAEFPKLTKIFNNIAQIPEIQSYQNSSKAIKNICPAGFYEKWRSICIREVDKID